MHLVLELAALPHLHELVHTAGSRVMAQLLCLLCWALCRCVMLRADLSTERVKALMAVGGSAVWVTIWCTCLAPAVGIETSEPSVMLAAQLMLAALSLLLANSRLMLSMSWGCMRCLRLALHGGVPRDLASLASEAVALLGCLVSLHCTQRLLEMLVEALLRRGYGRGYGRGCGRGCGRGYFCVTV